MSWRSHALSSFPACSRGERIWLSVAAGQGQSAAGTPGGTCAQLQGHPGSPEPTEHCSDCRNALLAGGFSSGGIESLAPIPQSRHPGWSSHQVEKHPKTTPGAPARDGGGATFKLGCTPEPLGTMIWELKPCEPRLGNCTRAGAFFHG